MRKGILLLCFAVLMLTALSSFAYSHYQTAAKRVNENAVCTINNSGETIFESMVKQFVGAVKVGK